MQHLWCTEGHVYQVWAFTLDFCSIAILISSLMQLIPMLYLLIYSLRFIETSVLSCKLNVIYSVWWLALDRVWQPACAVIAVAGKLSLSCISLNTIYYIGFACKCFDCSSLIMHTCYCSVCMCGSSHICHWTLRLAFVGYDQRCLMSGCVYMLSSYYRDVCCWDPEQETIFFVSF